MCYIYKNRVNYIQFTLVNISCLNDRKSPVLKALHKKFPQHDDSFHVCQWSSLTFLLWNKLKCFAFERYCTIIYAFIHSSFIFLNLQYCPHVVITVNECKYLFYCVFSLFFSHLKLFSVVGICEIWNEQFCL